MMPPIDCISPHRRSQFSSTVLANVPLCREHFRLVLAPDSFPATEPGQFVQIACRDLDAGEDRRECEWDWKPGHAHLRRT